MSRIGTVTLSGVLAAALSGCSWLLEPGVDSDGPAAGTVTVTRTTESLDAAGNPVTVTETETLGAGQFVDNLVQETIRQCFTLLAPNSEHELQVLDKLQGSEAQQEYFRDKTVGRFLGVIERQASGHPCASIGGTNSNDVRIAELELRGRLASERYGLLNSMLRLVGWYIVVDGVVDLGEAIAKNSGDNTANIYAGGGGESADGAIDIGERFQLTQGRGNVVGSDGSVFSGTRDAVGPGGQQQNAGEAAQGGQRPITSSGDEPGQIDQSVDDSGDAAGQEIGLIP